MTVRLSGTLSDLASANVGTDGDYEIVSEYVRDLIRRDKARRGSEVFKPLKAELECAYGAPGHSHHPLSAAEVIGESKSKPGG